VSTSYCSRLHNVNTKCDKRTAKKSVKVQAVLEDDTSNNKPIHFGVYKNNKIASMLTFEFIKILVLSSHATLKGTHSSLRLIMKDFFINKSQIDNWLSPKPIVIKTQLKHQLFIHLTIDMHLVHGILRTLQLQPTAL
jgi:hypothetical protein